MSDQIRELFATHVALAKLEARGISKVEAEQLLHNRYAMVNNLRGRTQRPQSDSRRLLIGHTDGGRPLTLVVERTIDPTSWLIVTGWRATPTERRLLVWSTPRNR